MNASRKKALSLKLDLGAGIILAGTLGILTSEFRDSFCDTESDKTSAFCEEWINAGFSASVFSDGMFNEQETVGKKQCKGGLRWTPSLCEFDRNAAVLSFGWVRRRNGWGVSCRQLMTRHSMSRHYLGNTQFMAEAENKSCCRRYNLLLSNFSSTFFHKFLWYIHILSKLCVSNNLVWQSLFIILAFSYSFLTMHSHNKIFFISSKNFSYF